MHTFYLIIAENWRRSSVLGPSWCRSTH